MRYKEIKKENEIFAQQINLKKPDTFWSIRKWQRNEREKAHE